LKVKILEGKNEGREVTVENDYLNLREGQTFFLRHITNPVGGLDAYSVADPYRLPVLYVLLFIFVVCVAIFGGKQGIRGLLALVLSFAFIGYFLLPGIIQGYSPILVSIGVSSLIIILGSYITHGFNKVTTSAVVGMVITIVLTGILAYASIYFGQLTGFASDEAVYLNLNTRGAIDFSGLLLGAILIGLLGILYDAAIGQAVAVDELRQVGQHLSRRTLFRRALRIGREHIGALVNTLAIAYVGAALPLLLLLYYSSAGFSVTINQEIFATEIVRTMIGSIGLILAVPLTTLISILMLVKKRVNNETTSPAVIAQELKSVEHIGHKH